MDISLLPQLRLAEVTLLLKDLFKMESRQRVGNYHQILDILRQFLYQFQSVTTSIEQRVEMEGRLHDRVLRAYWVVK